MKRLATLTTKHPWRIAEKTAQAVTFHVLMPALIEPTAFNHGFGMRSIPLRLRQHLHARGFREWRLVNVRPFYGSTPQGKVWKIEVRKHG